MLRGAIVLAAFAVLLGHLPVAWAQPSAAAKAEKLADQGRALGEAGKLDEAIEHFKAANRLAPHARHSCNIGRAYALQKQWPQARLFLRRCRAEWPDDKPVPGFVESFLERGDVALRAGDYARVALRVQPVGADVVVAALGSDAPVRDREIWLPYGNHELVVSKAGFHTQRIALEIRGRSGVDAKVDLQRVAVPSLDPVVAGTPRPKHLGSPGRGSKKLAWITLGVSGAAAVVGAGFHVLALQSKNDAEKLTVELGFHDQNRSYRRQRAAALSLYALAGVGAAVGSYLLVGRRDSPRRDSVVLIAPTRGGGVIALRWWR